MFIEHCSSKHNFFSVEQWTNPNTNTKMAVGELLGKKNQNQLSKCCESCYSSHKLTNAGHFYDEECFCFKITGKYFFFHISTISKLESWISRRGYHCWKSLWSSDRAANFQMRSLLWGWIMLWGSRWWWVQEKKEEGRREERDPAAHRARAKFKQKEY